MNIVVVYQDNEMFVDKPVKDIVLNFLVALGDWGTSKEESLGEPEWSNSEIEEYRMYISPTELSALVANQELLGIEVILKEK
jgi:hypothetical protein